MGFFFVLISVLVVALCFVWLHWASVAVHGRLTAVTSFVAGHGLQGTQASAVAACWLSIPRHM